MRCPRRSLRLNLTVDWALRWCSGATSCGQMAIARSRALQPKQIPPPASHMLPSQTDPTDDTNDIK